MCNRLVQKSHLDELLFDVLGRFYDDAKLKAKSGVLEQYECSVLIPSIKTAVEYNTNFNEKRPENDIRKAAVLKKNGYKLIRILDRNCSVADSNSRNIVLSKKWNRSYEYFYEGIKKLLDELNKDNKTNFHISSDEYMEIAKKHSKEERDRIFFAS